MHISSKSLRGVIRLVTALACGLSYLASTSGVTHAVAEQAPLIRALTPAKVSAGMSTASIPSPPQGAGYVVRTMTAGAGALSVATDGTSGHTFAANGNGTVSMIETATGILLRTTHVGLGWCTVVADTGRARILVIADGIVSGKVKTGATVSTLDARSGALLSTITLPQQPMEVYTSPWGMGPQAALDVHNGYLYIVVPGGVSVIDDRSGALLRTVIVDTRRIRTLGGYATPQLALVIDEAAGRVLVIDPGDPRTYSHPTVNGSVSVLDDTTGAVITSTTIAPLDFSSWSYVLAAGGRIFLRGVGSVSTLDAVTGAVLQTTTVSPTQNPLLLDQPANRVVNYSVNSTSIDLLDATTGALVRTAALSITEDAVSTDEVTGRIYVFGALGFDIGAPLRMVVLDGSTGDVLQTLDVGLKTECCGTTTIISDPRDQRIIVLDTGRMVVIDSAHMAVVRTAGTCWNGKQWDQAIVDTNSGRVFVVCTGLTDRYGVPIEDSAGTFQIIDVMSATVMSMPLSHVDVTTQSQVAGDTGFIVVPYSTGLSIIGPRHRTPADRVSPACCHARYFAQSGHNLAGPFLAFWLKHGGTDVLGYPRTEPFTENSRLVQYTDRFGLELVHGVVRTMSLQDMQINLPYFKSVPYAMSRSTATRLYFRSTGHTLSGPFLAYWRRHNGATLLGAPISEPVTARSAAGSKRRYLQQWFEKGRLDFHAEVVRADARVQPGLVGIQALTQRQWLL